METQQNSESKNSKKKTSSKDKVYWKRCMKQRRSKGLFMLDKKTEDNIYKMKQRLRKSGIAEEEIKKSINSIRRKEENKARRSMAKRCLRCRKSNHLLSECPEAERSEDVDETLAVCFRCGSTEHKLDQCSSSTKSLEFVRCFICREKGHLSRNCPQNTKGVYPKGGSCKKCGSKEHLVKDCPQEESEDAEEFTLPTLSDGLSADAEFEMFTTVKKQKPKVVKF